jgi:hypothetical protein
MQNQPRFRVKEQTEYGPILERIEDDAVPGERSSDTGKSDTVVDPDRRGFLKQAVGLSVAGAAVAGGLRSQFSDAPLAFQPITAETSDFLEVSHSQESPENISSFQKELIGYRMLMELKKDQVLFVDADNLPVGDPVPLQDFIGPKFHKDGRLLAKEYRFSPGNFNEAGLLEKGIAGEWINYAREERQREYPERPIVRTLHPMTDFLSSYQDPDEPALTAAIARGEIESYEDLITYFADKKVRGAEDFSRLEYVEQHMKFADDLPPAIAKELRRIVPGLCSQESKFNNGLTSGSGAQGIFQFMPETWAHYGGKPDEIASLRKQVEIAGAFFSDLYSQVRTNIGAGGMRFLERFFSDEESLQKDLLVPLMVNSYNAGAARMAEAVRLYIENTPVHDMPKGKDFFIAVADFAKAAKVANRGRYLTAYGKDAREYVPRVYAQAETLT